MRSGADLVRVRWCPAKFGSWRVLVVEQWLSASACQVGEQVGSISCPPSPNQGSAGINGLLPMQLISATMTRPDRQRQCSGGGPGPGIGRIGNMTSEPHRRTIGSLRAVALDAPDIDRLATFYEQLADWQRVPDDDDEWITLDTGDGWRMGLQRAIDHVPPHWPDQDRPQQAHLDFRVPDIGAAAERAPQPGATLLRRNERWHTP